MAIGETDIDGFAGAIAARPLDPAERIACWRVITQLQVRGQAGCGNGCDRQCVCNTNEVAAIYCRLKLAVDFDVRNLMLVDALVTNSRPRFLHGCGKV
jgi:hypothetical protein